MGLYGMWKQDWQELRQHFDDFWKREGYILSKWNGYVDTDRVTCPDPERELVDIRERMEEIARRGSWEDFYLDPTLVAMHQRNAVGHGYYGGDLIPFSYCDWGTVTLAPMLGAEQHFSKDTVWYTHKEHPISPENDRSLVLRDDDPWFTMLRQLVRTGSEWAKNRYLCGAPAVCGGLDVLAELRGASELCMDLVLEPEWVKEKLQEIDTVSRQAFHALYDIVKDDEGAMFHAFFMVWGRGKTSLIQCDFATLISEDMYREFMIPSILDAVSYLDYSLYHVDGPEALRTVDALLEIDGLDCIEFTPGPQVPQGGDPRWYPLYKKIKDAGKCVQAVEMQAEEVIPLLDAVGPEGMYLMVNWRSKEEHDEVSRLVDRRYRTRA